MPRPDTTPASVADLAGSVHGPKASLGNRWAPMIHPHTELRFISEAIGYGVVATRDIPAGTITWVQDELDRVLTPEDVERLGTPFAPTLDKYCFRDQRGDWILCWDHARFVNHSFRSNCMTTAFSFEIAVRDIRAGEELTDDYGYLNVMQPFEAIDEHVGRTTVYPDDLTRHHGAWDAQLRRAWTAIPKADQPLRGVINPATWKRVERIAKNTALMPSILECYYAPPAHGPSGWRASNGSTQQHATLAAIKAPNRSAHTTRGLW